MDTTFRGWSSILVARVRLVVYRLVLIFALPLVFMVGFGWSGLCIFRLLCMVLKLLCWPLTVCASFTRLFTGWFGLVVSFWLVLVLSLGGSVGCDLAFCVVWFRFRLFRRYLALWPSRAYRLL